MNCVQAGLQFRNPPRWRLPFVPEWTDSAVLAQTTKAKVAILREEGSNGDREMAAVAVHAAGADLLRCPTLCFTSGMCICGAQLVCCVSLRGVSAYCLPGGLALVDADSQC